MSKDAIDEFIAIWENATRVRYTTKGKRLFKETLQSAGYRLAGPGECVVPEEPTEAMLDAGAEAAWRRTGDNDHEEAVRENTADAWRAMLSASQQKAPGSGEASEGSK